MEQAHQLYAALAKGDAPALETLVHPDFVGTTAGGLPLGLGGRYVGLDAMRDDFWWRIGRAWRVEAVAEELHLLDDDHQLMNSLEFIWAEVVRFLGLRSGGRGSPTG